MVTKVTADVVIPSGALATSTGTTTTSSTGGGGSHNNMHPFLAVNFIIKT